MENELHLNEFRIIRRDDSEEGFLTYYVEPEEEETVCLHCSSVNTVRNGTLSRYARDLPAFGKQVALMVRQHRYLCRDCGKTCTHGLQSIEGKDRITKRLREQVKKDVLNGTFSSVAASYGLSVTIVKSIFGEYVAEQEKSFVRYAPKVLGIDEAHLNNAMRGVIVDVEERGLIEILPKRDKKSVIEYLESLPRRRNTRVVTMDMWRPYRDAVRDVLPHAMIVIDKFHVIKEVNSALESFRKTFQKSLDKPRRISLKSSRFLLLKNREDLNTKDEEELKLLLKVYPELSMPYALKESFRDIYAAGNRFIAEERFEEWKASIPKEYIPFFNVAATVENWHAEIFNYFDYRYTNAITESINNLIKSMEKAGRGYTFEVLRAKMLYGTMATKKPVYRTKPKRKEGYLYYATFDNLFDVVELERGSMVSIDAISEILQTLLCSEQKL